MNDFNTWWTVNKHLGHDKYGPLTAHQAAKSAWDEVTKQAADELGQLRYRLREVIKHRDKEREEANVEICRLRAELARLRSEVEALRARNESLAKRLMLVPEDPEVWADAERYRWMNSQTNPFIVFVDWPSVYAYSYIKPGHLTATIDAARKETK